ncbi:tRNA-splicing endonuclease subunit Sen2 isoform X2 [Simochromis diagramma]|uniref:tRNA-splicing endonuclease subunit Sen2 isoform X2 n=1 Tax=Simochromis diagramma TaxID=43689 RepID=UPI001A7EDFB1|nr:tRNA-splicing endonuclease subunit Sen2 isoform X2 [Simochromis diagramma]
MYADFRAPRRRLRVTEELEAPLPLSPRERSHFQAELLNQHVLVCDPEHSQKIHDQGYFGKGVLSRSRPEHSISNQWEQHEGVFLPVVSQARYEELLKWVGSALSAQGWDEEAVHQTLLRLSQPIQMEDVRNQMGGEGEAEENGERGKEEPEQEGGVSPQMKRSRRGSEVEPEAKRSCSSEQDSDSSLDCDPDSDPDPAPLVPGPGFLLVVSDSETGGGVREVRRTPFFLSEYLQLSLEEMKEFRHLHDDSIIHSHRPSSWSTVWAACPSTCSRNPCPSCSCGGRFGPCVLISSAPMQSIITSAARGGSLKEGAEPSMA